jgi:hypothetical protein
MKKELVLKEWQADIVRDDSKIIMVNTSRGGSKTFLLANKVLYEKPKTVLYISDYAKQLNTLKENFEEIFHSSEDIWRTIKIYNFSPDKLSIEFATGEKVTIYNKNFVTDEDVEIDMVLFDDGLPQLDIKAKKYMSVFTINYPIMNLFNNRGDISYYAVGLVHLERGLFTREKIEELKHELSPSEFMRDVDVCNDYNILAERWKLIDKVNNTEETPKRGQRRNANLYEESAGDFKTDQEEIEPIDFESLVLREKDKKKVIYGLFDSILEVNLPVIQKIAGDNYKVKIIKKLSSGNILYIREKNELASRDCYIKYENINPHKTLQKLTKEEIEDYLKRIVVGFIMEYDK